MILLQILGLVLNIVIMGVLAWAGLHLGHRLSNRFALASCLVMMAAAFGGTFSIGPEWVVFALVNTAVLTGATGAGSVCPCRDKQPGQCILHRKKHATCARGQQEKGCW